MKFIQLVIHSFINMPLRGHLLSVFEGLTAFAALELYAGGHEGWGVTATSFIMLFAYTDGAYGWSIRREEP